MTKTKGQIQRQKGKYKDKRANTKAKGQTKGQNLSPQVEFLNACPHLTLTMLFSASQTVATLPLAGGDLSSSCYRWAINIICEEPRIFPSDDDNQHYVGWVHDHWLCLQGGGGAWSHSGAKRKIFGENARRPVFPLWTRVSICDGDDEDDSDGNECSTCIP